MGRDSRTGRGELSPNHALAIREVGDETPLARMADTAGAPLSAVAVEPIGMPQHKVRMIASRTRHGPPLGSAYLASSRG